MLSNNMSIALTALRTIANGEPTTEHVVLARFALDAMNIRWDVRPKNDCPDSHLQYSNFGC